MRKHTLDTEVMGGTEDSGRNDGSIGARLRPGRQGLPARLRSHAAGMKPGAAGPAYPGVPSECDPKARRETAGNAVSGRTAPGLAERRDAGAIRGTVAHAQGNPPAPGYGKTRNGWTEQGSPLGPAHTEARTAQNRGMEKAEGACVASRLGALPARMRVGETAGRARQDRKARPGAQRPALLLRTALCLIMVVSLSAPAIVRADMKLVDGSYVWETPATAAAV